MLSLLRRSLCSPRPTPSRCRTCLARGFASSIRTAEDSIRLWSGPARGCSLLLTAEAGSVALSWLGLRGGKFAKVLRPREAAAPCGGEQGLCCCDACPICVWGADPGKICSRQECRILSA